MQLDRRHFAFGAVAAPLVFAGCAGLNPKPADYISYVESAITGAEGLVNLAAGQGWVSPETVETAKTWIAKARSIVAKARAAEAAGGTWYAYAVQAYDLVAEIIALVSAPSMKALQARGMVPQA